MRNEFVALRFVPQDAYAQAAALDISPPPDVVVRVYLVFKGISSDEVTSWPRAQARVKEPVARWRRIIGLPEADQLQDRSLFRILEWNGMEILT